MDTQSQEQVTQEDEAAVADVQWHLAAQLDETDRLTLVQAFARHRRQSLSRLEEKNAAMKRALERLAQLTPARANAHTVADLYLTVRAIAETALASGDTQP